MPDRDEQGLIATSKGVMELDVMGTGADLRAVQTFAAAAQRAGLSGLVVTEGSRTAYLTVAAAALARRTSSTSRPASRWPSPAAPW